MGESVSHSVNQSVTDNQSVRAQFDLFFNFGFMAPQDYFTHFEPSQS